MRELAFFRALTYLAGTFFFASCSATDQEPSPEFEGSEVIGEASSAMSDATLAVIGTGHAAGSAHFDASLSLLASATGCDNRGGPYVTIAGDLIIDGFGARLTASNNLRLTHAATVKTTASVILHNGPDPIRFSKGGQYGVTGNPEMYLEIYDHADHLIGSRIYLGRCNRPLPASKLDFKVLGDIDYGLATGECSGAGGPKVVLTGALSLRGIKAKLILQNRPGTKFASVPTEFAISLLGPGKTIVFDKRPPMGGVGGNPYFWAALTNHRGDPVTGDILFGRCNSLVN